MSPVYMAIPIVPGAFCAGCRTPGLLPARSAMCPPRWIAAVASLALALQEAFLNQRATREPATKAVNGEYQNASQCYNWPGRVKRRKVRAHRTTDQKLAYQHHDDQRQHALSENQEDGPAVHQCHKHRGGYKSRRARRVKCAAQHYQCQSSQPGTPECRAK